MSTAADFDPAPRCGLWVVTCRTCGRRVALTTAGRADDPRSLTMPCSDPPMPAGGRVH